MSGLQEILVIVLIVLALFIVPRMRQPSQSNARAQVKPKTNALFRGRTRLAILLSLVWVGLAAAYFQPWRSRVMLFVYLGPGPVLLYWGILWVLKGFRKQGGSFF